jgi:hypothetical protein
MPPCSAAVDENWRQLPTSFFVPPGKGSSEETAVAAVCDQGDAAILAAGGHHLLGIAKGESSSAKD